MISAGLEKCCCECQTQHGREKQQAAIAPCPSFMQALIKMHRSVQTRGLVIPTFSLVWVGIDLRESHWSSRSETRGWVSVEGLALTGTELMKLCTQTAHGHVTGAWVQHTRFAKTTTNFYSMWLPTKSTHRSMRELLTYNLLVFLWLLLGFLLRKELSCPPEDDIRLAKI